MSARRARPGAPPLFIDASARAFLALRRPSPRMKKTPRYDQGNTHDPRNPDTDDPAALEQAEKAIDRAQGKDDKPRP